MLPEITPWAHWLDVWDTDNSVLLWSGPILKLASSRESLTLSARDVSALTTRTRCPISKEWDASDPCRIAAELWTAMLALHNIKATPILRNAGQPPFNFKCEADTKFLQAVLDDLEKIGLRWTVVAGVPILGPVPTDATVLDERDLQGDIQVIRDGTETANDILVRGADFSARTTVPLGGLHLQGLVNLDSMFGVSNLERAAREYAQSTASIRDALSLPGGLILHPDTPVTIDDLLPGARFEVHARGLVSLMELESVEVKRSPGDLEVSVTLESVPTDAPELATNDRIGGGL
ncbi:minor tail protein [Tsukamurella phage TPA2]|uniref:minor tail protein n=1 Tax=Tsukamurella phage TPA2 TaxID=981330 RepID=UPI0001FF8DBA|nr:minor tail protein [Tsukamurella phage TPA2]ADX31949.1 hypothetical protein [Tsukamurella phage TPA2]